MRTRGPHLHKSLTGGFILAFVFGLPPVGPVGSDGGLRSWGTVCAGEPASASFWSELRNFLSPLFREDDAPVALPGTWQPSDSSERRFTYREGRHGAGSLRIVNHVPVLILRGTPEETAEQEAALTAEAAADLVAAPQELLEKLGYPGGWEGLVKRGQLFQRYLPEDYKRELAVLARQTGLSPEELLALNALPDMYRNFACSSLIVLPERSTTGTMLFGRNLDFFSPRQLYRYTIIKVYEQPGKRYRFASVGFPGFIGCLSGMNEAGLCLAVHEVHLTADGSPMFSPHGMPYALLLRRIMEECGTVDEAIAMLKASPRTTLLNIALCDTRRAAVAEITPRRVEVRHPENGICVCTNHFRTPSLRTLVFSWRYDRLIKTVELSQIDVATVQKKLDEANLAFLTIQSMVFEPSALVIHLASERPPATKRPYHRVDLSQWLKGRPSVPTGGE